ncbi:class I SAM-dependent methyltransferase [Pontivivens insulae]|uniref:Ubiquinone biosynthesis O-methyltransferase n=1 Tax=Pontivivens insulae TaxID=1639689 RepID=A0A2R8A818_9RHOB|nr:class I SAM-dependent methyltransferase [Pontivivens insulae]RED18280.1 methyltransferase family protein [Pontivivens insulae]SPF28178.1 Ubiquinone biosynthesis O-methyltransferase [Pontivivens insulae]
MTTEHWEEIYASGEQLNKYPFSTVVSFYFGARSRAETPLEQALDVGCGSGVHSGFLAQQGLGVTAFDVSKSSIAYARATFIDPAIVFHVADLAEAPISGPGFDLVVDHCATTHTTIRETRIFYQTLRNHLRPGAQLFWHGFAADNGFARFGKKRVDRAYENFSQGVFKPLGQVSFFDREDILSVFEGYQFMSLRHLAETDDETGIAHTSWIAEVRYED